MHWRISSSSLWIVYKRWLLVLQSNLLIVERPRRRLKNLTVRSRTSTTWCSPRVVPTTRLMRPCLVASHLAVTLVQVARRTSSTCTARRSITCLGASFPSETPAKESPALAKASVRCYQSSILSSWPATTKSDRAAPTILSAGPNPTFSSLTAPRTTLPKETSTCPRQLRMEDQVCQWTDSTTLETDQAVPPPGKCKPAWWPADVRNEDDQSNIPCNCNKWSDSSY